MTIAIRTGRPRPTDDGALLVALADKVRREAAPEVFVANHDIRSTHICPKCGSAAIDRVRRTGVLDHLVRLLFGWRVYRCVDCGRRFYDRPSS